MMGEQPPRPRKAVMKTISEIRLPFDNAARDAAQIFAVVATVLMAMVRPDTWRRTVRLALARQIFQCGVEAVGFTSVMAAIVGVLVVVQVQLWLVRVGQTALLGPVLVTVVIRELGPLLANLVVLVRSGTAMAAELGNMRIAGEVRVLDSQGLDPLLFLVLPRALGFTISVFCLAIIFILLRWPAAICLCFGGSEGWSGGGICREHRAIDRSSGRFQSDCQDVDAWFVLRDHLLH